jgi:hypothetical protein
MKDMMPLDTGKDGVSRIFENIFQPITRVITITLLKNQFYAAISMTCMAISATVGRDITL